MIGGKGKSDAVRVPKALVKERWQKGALGVQSKSKGKKNLAA